MTDKELKKLSRLELLEILLEESKENERLKEMLDKTYKENSTERPEGALAQLTEKLNSALSEVNRLADELRNVRTESVKAENVDTAPAKKSAVGRQDYPASTEMVITQAHTPVKDENSKNGIISDKKLYLRLMYFYFRNEKALDFLPPDIQDDVRTRLRGITNAGK